MYYNSKGIFILLRNCVKFSISAIFIILMLGLSGCTTTSNAENGESPYEYSTNEAVRIKQLLEQADSGDIFEGRSVAKTSTIGILRPRGSFLSADELWIPDMVKSAMNNNFRKFAAGRITVMNIADEEALNNEITRSLSGSTDELSLTARLAARALMTGNVIKIQGSTRFTLEFTVTDTETHAILASYSQNHSDIELAEGIAINKATESLLKDLDVRLNEAGLYALYGASNQADTALAKGLSAAESGQSLQAMNYLFNAAAYNTTASQTTIPLMILQDQNLREVQGAGTIVMDFFRRQELWQNRLDEFNDFYNSHSPFELFYTPPTPTNMRGTGEGRAYDLYFKIGLRWSKNQIEVMEKVLQEYILDGLYKNPSSDIINWELTGLPEDSSLFNGPDNFTYNLLVNVENERGDSITSGPITLNGSLYRYQEKIYADCTQVLDAAFSDIKYIPDQITPQLFIRIVSINGVNIKTVGENGFMRVAQTQGQEIPRVQPNSLPRGLSSMMEREAAAVERQRLAREREAAKEIQAREKAAEQAVKQQKAAAMKNTLRYSVGVYGGPIIGANAGLVVVSVEGGVGSLNAEFSIPMFPGTSRDAYKVTSTDDMNSLNLHFGVSYVFFGYRWFINVGPGLTMYMLYNKNSSGSSDNSKTYYIPNIMAKFDWRIYDSLYVRVGYRFDLFYEDLNPLFKKNSFPTIGKFFGVNSILFGLHYMIF